MSGVGDDRRVPFFWITITATKLVRKQYRIETTEKGAVRLVPVIDGDPGLSQVNSVYQALVEIANEARVREATGETSAGFVTERSKVALYAGASVKTVDRVVAFLERIGLVAVERRRKSGGKEHLPSRYTLIEPDAGGGDSESPGSDPSSQGGGDSESQNSSRSTAGKKTPNSPLSAIEEVHQCYVTTFGKRGKAAELREDERKIIRAALDAAELGEVTTCITTCERSDFHMKRGVYAKGGSKARRGGRYNSLGQILKPRPTKGETQRSRIDWWLEKAEEIGAGKKPAFDVNTEADRIAEAQGLA